VGRWEVDYTSVAGGASVAGLLVVSYLVVRVASR